MEFDRPRLRTVEKYNPPYRLNDFPRGFEETLAKEIIYIKATRTPEIEGRDWEAIFARCINAQHSPSNVGLDDVVLGQTAWGAKTVKATNPLIAKKARLISGRNSPLFSYGEVKVSDAGDDPQKIGNLVIGIWNERVDGVKQNFQELRTVVLLKGLNLDSVSVFEIKTIRYNPDDIEWYRNKNGNLIGKYQGENKFTWQPHGSQFTIIEHCPEKRLGIKILHTPRRADPESFLKGCGYTKKWFEVLALP